MHVLYFKKLYLRSTFRARENSIENISRVSLLLHRVELRNRLSIAQSFVVELHDLHAGFLDPVGCFAGAAGEELNSGIRRDQYAMINTK